MKDLKHFSHLFIAFLCIILASCSSNSDRLISAFTSEIGNSPVIKAQSSHQISYTWSAVSMIKRDIIKTIADKELKMQPTAMEDLGPALDENQNPVMGKIQQSWTYDTPDNKTVLVYQHSMSTIDIILIVTKK